ncbi:glutathione S-transferase family protein [Magnetococcales bacterium HHB-1]
MKLELIGYKVCPYVQRAILTLLSKEVEFTRTYIDPLNKPPWFTELAPTGEVPLLKIDDTVVLFDSTVICEFINEVTPNSLLPEKPLMRAKNRAWIQFASACQTNLSTMTMGPTEEQFQTSRQVLLSKLSRLEQTISGGPYFNGARFSMVDIAFAPLFVRLNMINEYHQTVSLADLPKISAWSHELVTHPKVKESSVSDLSRIYKGFLMKRGGFLKKLLKNARP